MYYPDISNIKNNPPHTKIGREKRFLEFKNSFESKNKVPHTYLTHYSSEIDMKTTATGFSKEKRFLVQNQKEKQNALSPSPSQYNSNIYNTISSTLYNKNSSRTGKLNLASSLSCSNKNKFNTHMYYKELERGYYYSISPGPAAYKNSADIIKSLSHTKNSASWSFPKVSTLL